VVVVVVWAIALAALIGSSVQLFAFRQAALGREAVQRVQTRWAARAGIENTIAMMTIHTEQPIPEDAWAMIRDLEFVAQYDELFDAGYSIAHHVDGRDYRGPMDESAKLNVNGVNPEALAILDDITPDVIAAVRDWLDSDDDPGMLGAEVDWYLGQHDYKPRNGPMRHIAEMELIAGIWGDFLRGEDWNLNNRKEPGENDADRTPPDDEPDDVLDAGWSGRLTVNSIGGGATLSGEPRIYLRRADPVELANRCGIDQEQAEALIRLGRNEQASVTQLITVPITNIDERGQLQAAPVNSEIEELTDDQLRAVLAETTTRPLYERNPGRININTASEMLIEDLLELQGLPTAIVDEIIYLRNSRAEGLTSILDLREIPDISPDLLQTLAGIFKTSGNVFTISSRGRSQVSGTEVEIIAVVDRSTVPVKILEYREQ
jgi:hypothetical protein